MRSLVISQELIGDSKPHQKRGRPIGAKDIIPRKGKLIRIAPEVAKISNNASELILPPEEVQAPEVVVKKPPEEEIAPKVAHAEVENAFIEAKGT